MSIRKSADIENESDSRYNNVKSTKKRAKITKRFDDTTHNPYPGDEALQYLSKKLDDIIDEANALRTASGSFSTRATTNDAKVSMVIGSGASQAKAGNTTTISTSQASAITANTAKVTQHPITANHTLAITIENDRSSGAPTHISFTVTNNSDGVRDNNRTKALRLELS